MNSSVTWWHTYWVTGGATWCVTSMNITWYIMIIITMWRGCLFLPTTHLSVSCLSQYTITFTGIINITFMFSIWLLCDCMAAFSFHRTFTISCVLQYTMKVNWSYDRDLVLKYSHVVTEVGLMSFNKTTCDLLHVHWLFVFSTHIFLSHSLILVCLTNIMEVNCIISLPPFVLHCHISFISTYI